MLLKSDSYKGHHQLCYDNKDEAIAKAEKFWEDDRNVCVISAKGNFFVFAPSPVMLHDGEVLIYKNGKRY